MPWNADALYRYLSRDFQEWHGVARGPMAAVADNLRNVPQEDVRAIGAYVAAQMGDAGTVGKRVAQQVEGQAARGKAVAAMSADSQADAMGTAGTDSSDEGVLIYASTCAGCHQGPRAMPYGGIDLALSSAIGAPNADNLVNVVLYGLPAAEAARAPIMPGFAAAMSNAELVALAGYLRAHFSDKGPWNNIENNVRDARNSQRATTDQAPPGTTQRTNNGEAQR